MDGAKLLLPRPRRLAVLAGSWHAPERVRLEIHAPRAVEQRLRKRARSVLARAGVRLDRSATHRVRLRAPVGPRPGPRDQERYRLTIEPGGAVADAGHARGLFHALTTLGQWLRLHRAGPDHSGDVPCVRIEDGPSFAQRGVLLDISRDQVPTLASLRRVVDQLADWKINQLQLYFEHTFAYAGHERVWQGASPLTPEQVRKLDTYCSDRGVELVPNQNSFGHFHRWLTHEPYRRLAECPDGTPHPFSRRREPFSLCATDPASLALLGDLYDQLLPCFASRRLNVGLDETFDLGQCRTRQACQERGKQRVYLDFVRAVHTLAKERGRSIQMWGDIVLEHPEHMADLPTDVTVLSWGYEADHPFDAQARQLRASGLPFYLCPGTSSWLSWAGRTHNALHNLAAATRAGRDHGAEGILVCDWGDHGHLQPWTASLPGLVAGAAFAWNADDAERPDDLPLGDLIDTHAFETTEKGLGKLVAALGNTYRKTGTRSFNGSPLFHLLASAEDPMSHDRYTGLDDPHIDAAQRHIGSVRKAIDSLAPGGDTLARQELRWSSEAMLLALDVGRARLAVKENTITAIPPRQRNSLANNLDTLIATRRDLWLARNRSGGLRNALTHLRHTARLLRGSPTA